MESSSMSSPGATPTAASESNSNKREGALSPIAASPRSSEDDMAFSVHAGLAKEAALHFQAGKYVECVHFLNQLLQKKENDPKIIHNIAIAESFQDGCSDPKKLLEVLNNVKKRSEELALASEEQLSESGGSSKATVGSKGNSNSALLFASSSSLPAVYSDEFDTSVAMFNMAAILFHIHEYAKSYSILDSCYQNIEPIDEGTALRICLLLLDVALVSNNASKAADVISYLEKVFCVGGLTNQVDNGNSSHQPNIMSKSSLPSIPDASNSDSGPSASALESSLSRTLSDEGLEDESLLSSLSIGRDTLSRPASLQSANDSSKTQIEDSLSTMDLRLKLHLYKVSFLLLTRNLKAAKREVKMAMNIARGKAYTTALYLKSQLEYARGNHRKAIKLLMASGNQNEAGISSIFYNNLGCIYYCIGKYHCSSVMFSKALSNSVALRKEKPRKLAPLSQDKSLQILYNCGLTYLAIGKPLFAARYFHRASLVSYNRPLLWLRIAECCLMALEKGLLKSSYPTSDGSGVEVNVFGQGKWRQLALPDVAPRAGKSDYVGGEDFSFSDDGLPVLSVTLALQCLCNASYLLERSDLKNSKSGMVPNSAAESSESGESLSSKNGNGSDSKGSHAEKGSSPVNMNGEVKEQKCGTGQNTYLLNSVSDYEEICRKERQWIKQAVLADMAYVEFQLGNPLKALSAARSLLKLSECSKIYLFLGNMYAAEALCHLNRPKEAAEHLHTYVTGGDNVEFPYSQDDIEKWRVEKVVVCEDINGGAVASDASDESQGFRFLKPEEALGVAYANLAAISAFNGDVETSRQFVGQALSMVPEKRQVILTAIYLDVLQGKLEDAVAKLKLFHRVRFLPGTVTLDGSS